MIFGAIGDALLASTILDSLRKAFPDSHLLLFLSRANKGVADLIFQYDQMEVVDVTAPWRAIPKLRNNAVDLLVDTSQWPRVSALLSFFSGARYCVGFKTQGQHRHYLYDRVEEHSAYKHELENFRSLAVRAGGHEGSLPSLTPPMAFDAEQYGIHSPYIVIHPWAAGFMSELREWPRENWVTLINALSRYGVDLVVTGGHADTAPAESLLKDISSHCPVISLAGKLTLSELRNCLAGSLGVVSVNTGVMHLASLLGVRVISLNGPTNAERWGGVGDHVFNLNVKPEDGGGFLNLGFEYPDDAVNVMGMIVPERVLEACVSHIFSASEK
tara:strand:+ start:2254 stop:3240 length:987 start_codon:yes stop_codon:yes gene_type:complete